MEQNSELPVVNLNIINYLPYKSLSEAYIYSEREKMVNACIGEVKKLLVIGEKVGIIDLRNKYKIYQLSQDGNIGLLHADFHNKGNIL